MNGDNLLAYNPQRTQTATLLLFGLFCFDVLTLLHPCHSHWYDHNFRELDMAAPISTQLVSTRIYAQAKSNPME